MATALPSALRSVPVIFVGHALLKVHTIFGVPVSSRRLIATVWRLPVFILISLYQVQNLVSLMKMPLRRVTLPTFPSPGILIGAKIGLLPCRNSIGLASLSRPLTS